MFYVAHTHLNYTKEEFWNSTFKEIVDMWNLHCKFNRWQIKDDNEENNSTRDASYKKVNIVKIYNLLTAKILLIDNDYHFHLC